MMLGRDDLGVGIQQASFAATAGATPPDPKDPSTFCQSFRGLVAQRAVEQLNQNLVSPPAINGAVFTALRYPQPHQIMDWIHLLRRHPLW
ncbi:hypothetical protein A4R29_04115 [Mesorhizobium ciceri biovar biserrulae]|nr:hypothetical protein A4R29_04115 [Mesorhizobium ciceri biovar biserrulae]